MRITIRLSTAGEAGFLSMPAMRFPADQYFKDRSLDEDKVRHEFASNHNIQISSDDGRDTLAFTVELLDRMKVAITRHMENNQEMQPTDDNSPKTAAQRRFDRGKMAFVRVDIRRIVSGFRVKLSAENPREVVGRTENFAKILAQAFADNIVAIADSLAKEKTTVILQEGAGCDGVFAQARKRNDILEAKMQLTVCPNRVAGYCSPCKAECPLFRAGRCGFDMKEDEL